VGTASVEPSSSSARSGAAWTLGAFLFSNLVRLGSNLLLTRLLFPEAFGLMTLVQAFMQGLTLLSDLGISVAIIQNPAGAQPRFLDTAWTVQVIRGAVLWGLSWAIALPLASLYGEPRLVWLIPGVGLTMLLSGFEATNLAMGQRTMQLRSLALMDMLCGLLGTLATLGSVVVHRHFFGPYHPSAVWAIVVGMNATALARTVYSHFLLPERRRHRWALSPDALQALSTLGRWIILSSGLMFLVAQADRLIFGKLIPLNLLGIYGIAAMLAGLPQLAAGHLIKALVLPTMSRAAEDFGALRAAVRRLHPFVLIIGGTLTSGLMACGPLLTDLLYDDRYSDVGWILRLLTFATWFHFLECFHSTVTLAQGRSKWLAAANAAKLVPMLVLLPLGFQLDGFRGALIGLVVSEVPKYAAAQLGVSLHKLGTLGVDLLMTVLVLVTSSAGILTGEALKAGGMKVAALFAAGLVTAALWGGIALYRWFGERTQRRVAAEGLSTS
jgi:O-antigen/teichoic acid export membrane protein